MRHAPKSALAIAALAACAATSAQCPEAMDHRQHMAMMQADGRQLVHFPPEMRAHTLSNMRDHLAALSEILAAMSASQYGKAAFIADKRLGLDSPSAEGCKSENASGDAPKMSKPMNMEHLMAQFMPEGMRAIGYAMHESATDFAKAASRAADTQDGKPALAALARVTDKCGACHSAYRVQ